MMSPKARATKESRERAKYSRDERRDIRSEYHDRSCSCCGGGTFYDGRCGDGPVCLNRWCSSNLPNGGYLC